MKTTSTAKLSRNAERFINQPEAQARVLRARMTLACASGWFKSRQIERFNLRSYLVLGVFVLAAAAVSRAESPAQVARLSLERARTAQDEILKSMSELMSGQQRPALTVGLINDLTQIHQMQLAVLQRTRSMVSRTFGQTIESLAEADRQAIEQLAVDQRGVRQRFADWTTALTRLTNEPSAAEGLRRLQTKAAQSSAGESMEQAADRIPTNQLAGAITAQQEAANAIARLVQLMELLTVDPEQLRQKRVRELMEIAEQEKGIRARLSPPPASMKDWQRLRQDQDGVIERTRLMSFEETGMAPSVLERVRAAVATMQSVQSSLRPSLRLSKFPEALKAAEDAVAILAQAITLLQSTDIGTDLDLPPSIFANPNAAPPTTVQTTGPQGVPLPDMNAIAQLAADISLVTKILRAEKGLHAEVLGQVPPMPNPADRQAGLANQLPQVIRRVLLCVPQAGTALDRARVAMTEAADRLRANDSSQAADRQAAAITHLTDAQTRMLIFWKQVIDMLGMISSGAPGQSMTSGASDKEADKARLQMMMRLLPELVRLGNLVKTLDELIVKTGAWVSTAPADSQASTVAGVAKAQRDLAAIGLDIAKSMTELGEEVSGSVPKTIRDAVDFMNGAAEALDDSNFEKANGRQVDARDLLQHAWAIVASNMASASNSQQSAPNPPGQTGVNAGEGGGGISESVAGERKPWYWNLPPQAREAIVQSLAEPFPPKYEPAVKRYYERLSSRKASR